MQSICTHQGRGYSPLLLVRRPSIYCLPKTIRNINHSQKKSTKILFPFCTLTLRKTIKCIEMTPKNNPVLRWPPINVHKLIIPQKLFIYLKKTKILKFKILNVQKAYVYMKMPEYPTPPGMRTYHYWFSHVTQGRAQDFSIGGSYVKRWGFALLISSHIS